MGSVCAKSTVRARREQLDLFGKKYVAPSEVEEYNRLALNQIMQDTGYDEAKAKDLQTKLIEYLGEDYDAFARGEKQDAVRVIDAGLAKMPAYDGTIYRGMSFSNIDKEGQRFRDLQAGDQLTMRSISSWTSEKHVAEEFGDSKSTGLDTVIIQCDDNKTGVGVQHISKFNVREAEVLAPSTASWTVESVTTQSKYEYEENILKELIKKAKASGRKHSEAMYLADLRALRQKTYFKTDYVTTIKVKEN